MKEQPQGGTSCAMFVRGRPEGAARYRLKKFLERYAPGPDQRCCSDEIKAAGKDTCK